MTIEKGHPWGVEVVRPSDLRIVCDDAELATFLDDASSRPVAVSGGDMFSTTGSRNVGGRDVLQRLPIDLMRVTLDERESCVGVAHLVVRSPWRRGGWFRGPVLAVMNAEYFGDFDVAPRGHPNDGRVETLMLDAAMTPRQRVAVRRRLRSASHLPHPLITTRSTRSAAWEFDRPMHVEIDGVDVGEYRRVGVVVDADAGVLFA